MQATYPQTVLVYIVIQSRLEKLRQAVLRLYMIILGVGRMVGRVKQPQSM